MRNSFYAALAAAALALVPGAARADWKAAETAHFVIYSESSDKDVERLATRLETMDGLMRMAAGIADKDVDPVKVRMYEVASTQDVENALGLNDSGVAGFYDSNILGPFLVTPRKTYYHVGDFTPELVLHHEYAHHFMLQYFPAVYPSWYVEGFAELVGSSKILPDGKVGYGMPAKHRGNEIAANWTSIEDLILKPPHKVSFDTYGQGWAMTHFFTFSKERAPQLRAYLTALRAGKPPAEAARVFGDLKALDKEARGYVTRGVFEYRPVPVQIATPVIKSVRPVSSAEAALIPEVIAFRDDDLSIYRKEADRNREQHLREVNLQHIREKVKRFATDPFALQLLAVTEYDSGNYAQSEAAADRLLTLQPANVRGMVVKSLNLARAAGTLQGDARKAKMEEARKLALKANRADPNDALPLLAFFESYHLAGERAPRPAMDALASVVQTLPANVTARQLLVDELAAQKRFVEAINQLQPIANSPHESPMRAAAREKMAKLQAELAAQSGKAQPAS